MTDYFDWTLFEKELPEVSLDYPENSMKCNFLQMPIPLQPKAETEEPDNSGTDNLERIHETSKSTTPTISKKRKCGAVFQEEHIKNFKQVMYNELAALYSKRKNSEENCRKGKLKAKGKKQQESDEDSDYEPEEYSSDESKSEEDSNYIKEITIVYKGKIRRGFQFNPEMDPEAKLAELYALNIRGTSIEGEDKACPLIQDVYKFYARAAMELLAKYFEKKDKFTYLYMDKPLFVPGESIEDAENRLRSIGARSRKRSRR